VQPHEEHNTLQDRQVMLFNVRLLGIIDIVDSVQYLEMA